jgi:hypothetical protein
MHVRAWAIYKRVLPIEYSFLLWPDQLSGTSLIRCGRDKELWNQLVESNGSRWIGCLGTAVPRHAQEEPASDSSNNMNVNFTRDSEQYNGMFCQSSNISLPLIFLFH